MMLVTRLHAQDFGFGFDDDAGETFSVAPPVAVKVSGDIGAEFLGFIDDFSSQEKAKAASFGDILSGSLNFSAAGANVDAFIGLNVSAAAFDEIANGVEKAATPLLLDEAYLRSYFGPVNIEAGYRKLSWGKADSMGPLDVTNPFDYTSLTNLSDIQALKIARPMVHVTWNTGNFSKLEAVFIPNFTGHRFAGTGRWAPAQLSTTSERVKDKLIAQIVQDYSVSADAISDIIDTIINTGIIPDNLLGGIPPEIIGTILGSFLASSINDTYPPVLSGAFSGFSPEYPDTSGLEYFQAGLRFTTTVGPADIGAQYFYGNLFQPDFSIGNVNDFIDDLLDFYNLNNILNLDLSNLYTGNPDLLYRIKYNRYHQIGVDYAQILFGFNVRSEFALFLTSDLKGDDGSVRNPFLGWSLGFDRDLFGGINANIQANETIRLMDDKVGNDPLLDCEAGTEMTSTRLTMQLSKRFLRDELETKAIVIWDIENSDCYIIPAIVWNIKDVTAELAAGFFTGNTSGDLGQYWKNSYIKLGMKYSF